MDGGKLAEMSELLLKEDFDADLIVLDDSLNLTNVIVGGKIKFMSSS